jgi:hypothetical protein
MLYLELVQNQIRGQTGRGQKMKGVTRPGPDPPQRESAPPPPPALTPAPTSTGMAFSSLANEYLDHAQRRFADKTYQDKVYVYRQLLLFVGDIPVVQITMQTGWCRPFWVPWDSALYGRLPGRQAEMFNYPGQPPAQASEQGHHRKVFAGDGPGV